MLAWSRWCAFSNPVAVRKNTDHQKEEKHMKKLVLVLLAVGFFGGAAIAFSGDDDHDCPFGSQWNEAAQMCIYEAP